ncbi:hypothetical protein [Tardiphaga sp.]|uniref:hypothetical protein n=1 Tax=Tardiphaga sp. TaxID=1926292 RepID=UPI0025E9D429|nr:hypothetical protein [Tardiphaga sp.]
MSTIPTISTPPEPCSAQPRSRSPDLTLAEIVKLQSDAEYIKRDVSELRTDFRDVRDRLARLEERVLHLPGKGFIVVVVTTALVIIGGLVTIAPKPQALLQTATRHG